MIVLAIGRTRWGLPIPPKIVRQMAVYDPSRSIQKNACCARRASHPTEVPGPVVALKARIKVSLRMIPRPGAPRPIQAAAGLSKSLRSRRQGNLMVSVLMRQQRSPRNRPASTSGATAAHDMCPCAANPNGPGAPLSRKGAP